VSLFGKNLQQQIRDMRAQRTQARGRAGAGYAVLILGGGGREYAIAWRLARDASVDRIEITPGTGGMGLFAHTLDFAPTDLGRLQQHVAAAQVDLAIVGPDELIARGLADDLRRTGIATVGASREASRLEWSKSFAKEVMDAAGVPTASWKAYPSAAAAAEALPDRPVVVKADGLAAGKGVVVARSRKEALDALDLAVVREGKVVLEEVLEGPEASLLALVDGETVVPLPPATDHKRVGDGDTGPNTGGMGCVTPTKVLPDDEAADVARVVLEPIAREMVKRGTPYRGVLYAGLMRTKAGFKVIEYNARFGDPEAEVVLPRVGGDFGKLMHALGSGRLAEHVAANPVRFEPRAYVSVAVCAAGYPGAYEKGKRIEGLDSLPEGVYAFHAGTINAPNGGVLTSGGRVLHIVGGGDTVKDARERAYAGAKAVRFEGAFFRSDIALREV